MAERGAETAGLPAPDAHPVRSGPSGWGGPAWRRWHRGGPPWWNRADGDEARSRRPWRSTLALTVVVMVGSNAAAELQQDERAALDPFARVLLLVGALLLLWRWRHPVLVAFGTSATAMVYLGAGYPYGPVFVTVAVGCFSAIVAGHRRAAWAAMGALWVGHVLVAHWLYRWLPPDGDGAASWGQEIVVVTWGVAIVALSELARTRREQWARERTERARAARLRADEERLRIARELHDVLAHSISVINVQAGVGLALLDSDPEQARTALSTIKAASKEALGEVRQVLDTLRTPGDAPRAPAPGLDRLPELVEQAAGAGLTVTVEGERPDVPPGADLAAFRIVQEALTNVVRHSGSRHARVGLDLDRAGCELRLRIDDDGPAISADAGGGGNGLVGMRERAAALGGTIEAGPRADGGFRVLAVLPVRASREVEEDR
ncbi:sensor histidine kinase [Streptomyces sp. SP17KL33]|uniref:sensor histidine kinase n=1 Tax=Streptomyces sp. SP17KL33 TaxID=3002534 RepID=UPI002E770C0B|nr:sensor histidine kinase [Streptomyces sp. SP17KL33]MEE1832907.1 sensor histidine kinase [Streptomyces sp. SP17KL33]